MRWLWETIVTLVSFAVSYIEIIMLFALMSCLTASSTSLHLTLTERMVGTMTCAVVIITLTRWLFRELSEA